MINQKKYTWDLSPLYKSDNDPQIEKDIEEISSKVDMFVSKWKNDKSYLNDPKVLSKAFKELEDISLSETYLEKPLSYFWLRKEQENDNPTVKAMYSKINDKEVEITNKLSFFGSNVVKKIPKKLHPEFLKSKELMDYKHTLEKAFLNRKHLLSDKEEKIYRLLSKTSYENWDNMISEFISKSHVIVNKKKITFEEALKQTQDVSKKKRDLANDWISEMLNKVVDSAEYELNSIIKSHNISSIEHKFKSFDELRHISDDIDSKSVNSMIKAVTNRFDISQRYYKLYAKLLNQNSIKYHERSISLNGTKKVDSYDFNKSIEIVRNTFKNLDFEFFEIFENLLKKNRIDVFSRSGKSGGAFCFSMSKNIPTYILLNHNDKENDVLTISHEVGHAIHAILSQKHQHPNNSGHSLATAEVASTFFEDFTLSQLNKNIDKEKLFYTLQKKLLDDVSTIFRQVACYNFELELHEEVEKKGFLSKKEIGEIFIKNMSAYMGESVVFDDSHKLWWVYWSHLRRPFYVYSYASGLLISKALQNKVKKEKKFISSVKKFLCSGEVESPKDIFLNLGIDISKPSFWSDGIKEIENMLNEFESLGKELGKF